MCVCIAFCLALKLLCQLATSRYKWLASNIQTKDHKAMVPLTNLLSIHPTCRCRIDQNCARCQITDAKRGWFAVLSRLVAQNG